MRADSAKIDTKNFYTLTISCIKFFAQAKTGAGFFIPHRYGSICKSNSFLQKLSVSVAALAVSEDLKKSDEQVDHVHIDLAC